MRSIAFAILAGEVKQFSLSGKFFYLSKCIDAVSIELWSGGHPVDDIAINVLAGFKTRPQVPFDTILVKSATDQTIEFFVTAGEGGYDRFNISGKTTSKTQKDLIAQGRFTSADNTGVQQTVVAKTTNVNGIIVFSAVINVRATVANLTAKAVLPCFGADSGIVPVATKGIIATADNMQLSTDYILTGKADSEVLIPAGYALLYDAPVAVMDLSVINYRIL